MALTQAQGGLGVTVTSEAASGTNSTAKHRWITFWLRTVSDAWTVTVNGTQIMNNSGNAWTGYSNITFVVPPGGTWAISAPGNAYNIYSLT